MLILNVPELDAGMASPCARSAAKCIGWGGTPPPPPPIPKGGNMDGFMACQYARSVSAMGADGSIGCEGPRGAGAGGQGEGSGAAVAGAGVLLAPRRGPPDWEEGGGDCLGAGMADESDGDREEGSEGLDRKTAAVTGSSPGVARLMTLGT